MTTQTTTEKFTVPVAERSMTPLELFDAMCNQPDGGDRYFNLKEGYKQYGYSFKALPFPSTYEGLCNDMAAGLELLDQKAAYLRKTYRFRGFSHRLLAMLHKCCPEPTWGARPEA